jgi:tRNA dimethylallyltransferase
MRKIEGAKVLFIIGPTAIGKTDLAINLARRISGEIISCDSMQVYKGMAVLSQAPSRTARREIKHHLIDLISPTKEYSAAIFKDKAERIIRSMIRRGKVPIIVGGSGLYVKAIIDGLFPSPAVDLKFRSRMEKFVSRYGRRRLYERLKKIDPESAGRIHQNDTRRIIRALEIYNSTGRTMTELKAATHGIKEIYDIELFGLTAPRPDIYENIERRIDKMFDSKIIGEVKKLMRLKLSRTAKAALGFKEVAGYLNGEHSLEEAISRLKMNTRRFAKRQLTWFKADKRIKWFNRSRMGERAIIREIAGR